MKLLYHAVASNTDGHTFHGRFGTSGDRFFARVRALRRGVSSSPMLASLINTLSIGIEHYRDMHPGTRHYLDVCSRYGVAILAACRHLERLHVGIIRSEDKERLLDTISARPRLRVLDIRPAKVSDEVFASFTVGDYFRILDSCLALETVSLSRGHESQLATPASRVSDCLRRLELREVSMTENQLSSLLRMAGPSLESLVIEPDNSGSYGTPLPYPGLCTSLPFLAKLQHLELDGLRQQDDILLHPPLVTLLGSLGNLRIAYLSNDMFPVAGFGHLSSPQIQLLEVRVDSWLAPGFSETVLTAEQLVAGLEALLSARQMPPKCIVIRHELCVADSEREEVWDGTFEGEDEILRQVSVPACTLEALVAKCAAAAVTFTYTARIK